MTSQTRGPTTRRHIALTRPRSHSMCGPAIRTASLCCMIASTSSHADIFVCLQYSGKLLRAIFS